MLLVNPAGRLVEVNTQEEVNYWLTQPGFSLPSEQEENEYKSQRLALANKQEIEKEGGKRIYFCTVSGIGRGDGFGTSSKLMIDQLQKLGVKVDLDYNQQRIGFLYHNPYSVIRMENPYKIVFTMFESDRIPRDWPDYLSEADLVIVPSKWCQEVFKKCGVETTVVNLGYNENSFKFIQRKTANEERRPFTFLHYNAFNIRKGFPEVFKAFVEEFDPTEPVRLIFKTTLGEVPAVTPITKREYPNIDIILGQKTEAELMGILKESDCFVFPSRGEGFGITPLEAMATGMPAIVPNAHGISEYFNAEYMYEVKVGGTCPGIYHRYKNQDVGNMVICDVADLRRQMRWVYEHQKEALEVGHKASEYVKNYTYSRTAENLKVLIDQAYALPLHKRKLNNLLPLERV